MRIKNFVGLKDVDWTFPLGPVYIAFAEISQQKFRGLLQTILFNQQESQLLSGQYSDTLIEMWISGEKESENYYIRHEYIQTENELIQNTTLFDKTGQKVNLPEQMMLGEYLFNVQLQAYLQGVIVEWPEKDHHNDLIMLISNLSQGGDEGLSLKKMRASLTGAQKKVNEQKENIELVKAEYDTLRVEWEAAHRHQEEERLLQIEIKNLQEKEAILTERIAETVKIQKRLELLSKNADYRALRQLHDEITRLETRRQSIEESLKVISLESSMDGIIESYRAECAEWAFLQKEAASLNQKTMIRSNRMDEIENCLLTSGYQGFREDEDLQLRRVAEERDAAQEELNKLMPIKQELEKLQFDYLQENARFTNLAIMTTVTEDDKNWIEKKEKHLELWRRSNIGKVFDGMLQKRFGIKCIDETLSSRLFDFYQKYHVSDYQEFTNQLQDFYNQQKEIHRLQKQMEILQEKVNQEDKLHRIVNSCDETLKQAYTAVNVSDFSEWLKGWADFRRKKHEFSSELYQLNLELKQKSEQEKKVADCAERMSENLKNWGIPATDREEVLAAIFKVASQLQERDEVGREIAAFKENFERMLGKRDMEQLSKILEPLAELERESRLSNEKRQAELLSWNERRTEIHKQIETLSQSLQEKRKSSSLSVLEKRIEQKRSQWMGYEDLRHALEDAQTLLELSWQEWQTKYEKKLLKEKQWIYEHSFSSVPFKLMEADTLTKRNYFSYRMAVAQLAIHLNNELPLLFLLGKKIDDNQNFWEDVIQYLYQFSFSRQLIICTMDSKMEEILAGEGWSSLSYET